MAFMLPNNRDCCAVCKSTHPLQHKCVMIRTARSRMSEAVAVLDLHYDSLWTASREHTMSRRTEIHVIIS